MRNAGLPEPNGDGIRSGPLWVPIGVISLTVLVFGGAILLMEGLLRERLRDGILVQEGKVLQAAAAAAKGKGVREADSEQERLVSLLEASNIREDEVFAVRLFDENGKFVIGFPADVLPVDLSAADLKKIAGGEVVGHFDPPHDISVEFRPNVIPETETSVLRAIVPIFSRGRLIRAAEFLMVGTSVEGQLREVDRFLSQSAFWFCLIGGIAISVPLALAFRRLHRSNTLLSQRTANLLRANHELTLAAKTSAVGAVAAHLIHGLKNPLFGLQAFVSGRPEEIADSDWQAAADSAKRMQLMIADVIRILQEENAEQEYELSLAEAVSIFENKLATTASEAKVTIATTLSATGSLANREANLLILALSNLAQNAIQASPAGGKVEIRITDTDDSLEFEVVDQGPGLPERVAANLFMPCQSTKVGGTGLGLAITKQLASHLGGNLELVKTGESGTTFKISLPKSLLSSQADIREKAQPAVSVA